MAKKKTRKKAVKKQTKKTPGPEQHEPPPKVVPYPEAGKKVTEFEEKLDQQIAGTPPKRGRGRPRKEAAAQPEFTLDENIIRQTIKMPFDLWSASQKLDELKLQDPEAAALAAPAKQLLDYYLPNMPTIVIAWLSLAVTSYSIMVTRLSLIAEIKKQKKSSASSDSVGAKDVEQGRPRPSDSKKPRPGKNERKNEFPTITEPVQI